MEEQTIGHLAIMILFPTEIKLRSFFLKNSKRISKSAKR